MIVPKIDVFAEGTYNPDNPFTYTYQDYPYWFSPESTLNMPENIGIYSDVLDYVIEIGASAQVLQFSSYYPFGFVLGSLSENIANYIFSLVINARIALGKAFSWVLPSNVNCVYAWQIKFLGVQDSYLDYDPNLYGPAYGWRFEGLLGEDIDVVLDQYGDFYGDNVIPHGNYTFTDESDEVEWISVHQIDGDEDLWWSPSTSISWNDLKSPYFVGKDLHFFTYDNNGIEHEYVITNFVRCFMAQALSYSSNNKNYYFLSYCFPTNTSHIVTLDGVEVSFPFSGSFTMPLNGQYLSYSLRGDVPTTQNSNLPSYPFSALSPGWNPSWSVYTATQRGIYQGSLISGNVANLWLDSISVNPVTDPVDIPTGEPIPFSDLPQDPSDDPTDFDPDPSQDPDPVPGSDYPEPEPQPTPVPPVPPIVSGNDDLWPDMNEIFNTEAEMDSFLTPLSNFEFTSLANLTDEFSASIVWVSTIMMSLYNGSEYSVLFSILAIFFIACALLGIYKWWSS